MNWELIGERKDGSKQYRHLFRKLLAEEVQNGKLLVYNDTTNAYHRYPRIVTRTIFENL